MYLPLKVLYKSLTRIKRKKTIFSQSEIEIKRKEFMNFDLIYYYVQLQRRLQKLE